MLSTGATKPAMTAHHTPTWLSADELSAHVITALSAPDTDADELRANVHALVSDWKAHGWTIERMIIQLKRFVTVAQERHSQTLTWVDVGEMGDRVITWCIERFYARDR